MASAADNPMGVEWFGMVMGLGFVLSFGYWCTDFLVVQRAMAANSMSAARRTPLIAAIPKMLFPALVIVPGMIAMVAAPCAEATVSGGRPPPTFSVSRPRAESFRRNWKKTPKAWTRPCWIPQRAGRSPISTWPPP